MKTLFSILFISMSTLLFAQEFKLPALAHSYASYEPYIDAQTMEIHHSKHHQAYVTNLNKALAGTKLATFSLNQLLMDASFRSDAIRNNAGGHYNHSLFWEILAPKEKQTTVIQAAFEAAIKAQYGSMDSLKKALTQAASTRFGSGWAWLIVPPDKKLMVTSTGNQDNPIMDVTKDRGIPILGIDVWEHAYYLKYQNKRGDYLSALWSVVNWTEVSKRYKAAMPKPDTFAAWPEIKTFHKVMSQTFHPSEEGNLQPIKERSAEMAEKANALKMAKIPAEFNKKQIVASVNKLAKDSKALDKLVKSKASDEKITKALNGLHDTFHTIVGLCTHDEE